MTLLSASSAASAMTLKQGRRGESTTNGASSSNPRAPASVRSSASQQSLPLKAHGVRAHLADLLPLPRHALFNVKLTIHQLWNVPLVAGDFSVRWKFEHVHRVRRHRNTNGSSSNGLLSGRVTPVTDSSPLLNGLGKGKGREVVDPERESLTPSGASMLSIPSTSEDSSSAPTSPRLTSVDLPLINQGEREGGSVEFSQEPRGRTPYVALWDHNVKWGKTINVVVQMSIQRDTQDLQPCELKLVVEQFCSPGDPDAPENPRLGAVFLNLAEYVDKGAVARRYLLRQSKTNATLQLTVELTHIGGERTYKAPPLQKGEVMAGIATLLEKSAVGGIPRPVFDRALSRPTINTHRRATDGGSRSSRSITPLPELGIAGLRTTDNIIEAIFNPVPTTSHAPSPFTYHVPPNPRPSAPPLSTHSTDTSARESPGPKSAVSTDADADVSGNMDDDRPPSIAPSSTRSERSIATSASRDSASASTGEPHHRKWWKKLVGGSRAASPQPPSPVFSVPPAQSGASVRSSPGVLTQQTAPEDAGDVGNTYLSPGENRSAPQIVVRSPTAKSKAPSTFSDSSGRS